MTRRISFEGDDTAYITFLEARILQLESSLRQSSQKPTFFQTSSSGPANLNADRNKGQFFGIPHRNTCQIQTASDDQSHNGDTQLASPDLDEQRYLRQNSGDSAAIQIVEYNPNAHLDPDETNQSAQNQTKKQQVRTLARFSNFLDDLPQSDTWKGWVSNLGDVQRSKILRALVQDCGAAAPTFSSLEAPKALTDVSSESRDISILSEYATFMISIGKGDRQLSCFRKIIFVSLCAVALEMNKSEDKVYEVMRKVLGTNGHSKHLLKLVRGAKWANRLISLLSKTKWASRSWDIIFIGILSVVLSF